MLCSCFFLESTIHRQYPTVFYGVAPSRVLAMGLGKVLCLMALHNIIALFNLCTMMPNSLFFCSVVNSDSETVYISHFRGRKLRGEVFLMPTDSKVLVVQGDDTHSLEEEPSVLRVVGGPIEKLLIWNTDFQCDVSERLRSALIWSKLNAPLPR